MAGEPSPYVSIKLQPIGRPQTVLLDDLRFNPPLTAGEAVIVRTELGHATGTVVRMNGQLAERKQRAAPARIRVVRRAVQADFVARLKQTRREQEAYRIALLKVRERGLEMKLTRAELQMDGSRVVFYFTAEGRVDFRDLVRELASELHTRIEMRQIGARDEAKMLGGYGSCGRPLCCTTFLNAFEPVSIKMAKRQEMNLNPSRLSGLCGRLKCCLRYELPNASGEVHKGCGDEGGCGNPTGCGAGGCGSGGCGSCR